MSKYRVTFYLVNNGRISCNIEDVDQLKFMMERGKYISLFDDDRNENIIPVQSIEYLKITDMSKQIEKEKVAHNAHELYNII